VPLFAAATGAEVGAAVAALVAAAVAPGDDFFVATGYALFVATVAPEAIEGDDEADALIPVPVEPIPPAMFKSLELNCGGVIARTAPRPPTVPPAINNARFISYPHFVIAPREDQHPYTNLCT
jgi:hypothetical protein